MKRGQHKQKQRYEIRSSIWRIIRLKEKRLVLRNVDCCLSRGKPRSFRLGNDRSRLNLEEKKNLAVERRKDLKQKTCWETMSIVHIKNRAEMKKLRGRSLRIN